MHRNLCRKCILGKNIILFVKYKAHTNIFFEMIKVVEVAKLHM
jgi:hypothetical protein